MPTATTIMNTQYPTEITFEHPWGDPKLDRDGPSPYVSLIDPEEDLQALSDPDVPVAPGRITVVCSYPLSGEYEFELYAPTDPNIRRSARLRVNYHFTRKQLAQAISELYQRIYREEEESLAEPAGNIPGMYNRVWTHGKYGIWGHHLGDLVLYTVYRGSDGKYRLGIDS